MKITQFVVILVAVMVSFSINSYACDCDVPKSAMEAFERSDAVFTGTVVDMKEIKRDREMYDAVLIDVDQAWKGIDETEAIVYTDWSDCRFDFTVGETYLIYSVHYKDELYVMNCGRSSLLSNASNDITELGDGEKPSITVYLSDEFNSSKWNYIPVILLVAIVVLAAFTRFIFIKMKK